MRRKAPKGDRAYALALSDVVGWSAMHVQVADVYIDTHVTVLRKGGNLENAGFHGINVTCAQNSVRVPLYTDTDQASSRSMSTVPQTTRNYSSGLQSGMSRLVLMNLSYFSLKKASIVAGPRNQL